MLPQCSVGNSCGNLENKIMLKDCVLFSFCTPVETRYINRKSDLWLGGKRDPKMKAMGPNSFRVSHSELRL